MESACPNILNNTSYFQWLSYMMDLLRSKWIYIIASGIESKPTDEEKKAKWENKQDQARGLIVMSISQALRFHILEIDTLDEVLKKLNTIFGMKIKSKPTSLKMIWLLCTPIISPLLNIFFPNSRPLYLF